MLLMFKFFASLCEMLFDTIYVRFRLLFLKRRYYRYVQLQFIVWLLQQQHKANVPLDEFAIYIDTPSTKLRDLISNAAYLSLKEMVKIALLLGYKINLTFEPLSEIEHQEIQEVSTRLIRKPNIK